MNISKPRKINRDKIRMRVFDRRYELLLISIFMMMFDSLLFKNYELIYERYIWPLNMVFYGIATSRVIITTRKTYFYILIVISILAPVLSFVFSQNIVFERLILLAYTLLHVITLSNVVRGIFKSKTVSFNMILGAFCGYLLLGLIASFLNIALLSHSPDAIRGLSYFSGNDRSIDIFSNVMYYSFITMTSIGYGDIIPMTINAKMLSVFIGILGQFYTTIIVALIIGKYLNQKN